MKSFHFSRLLLIPALLLTMTFAGCAVDVYGRPSAEYYHNHNYYYGYGPRFGRPERVYEPVIVQPEEHHGFVNER